MSKKKERPFPHAVWNGKKWVDGVLASTTNWEALDFNTYRAFVVNMRKIYADIREAILKGKIRGFMDEDGKTLIGPELLKGQLTVCDAVLKTLDAKKDEPNEKIFDALEWKLAEYWPGMYGENNCEEDPLNAFEQEQSKMAELLLNQLHWMWNEQNSYFCCHNLEGDEIPKIIAFKDNDPAKPYALSIYKNYCPVAWYNPLNAL